MLSINLAEWPDNRVLYTDPRREDPLYYYKSREGWSFVIGFEVAPMYEEYDATSVTIKVWPTFEVLPVNWAPNRSI